jgi:hypothetical protein
MRGNLSPYPVVMPDASLASRAVGRPSAISDVLRQRLFEHVDQKMLHLKPLTGQLTDPTDGVLGPYAADHGTDHRLSDPDQAGARPQFWSSLQ